VKSGREHTYHAKINRRETNPTPQGAPNKPCSSSINECRRDDEEADLPRSSRKRDKSSERELAEVSGELLLFTHPLHASYVVVCRVRRACGLVGLNVVVHLVDFDIAIVLAGSDGIWTRSLDQFHGSFFVGHRSRHLERFNTRRQMSIESVVLLKRLVTQRETSTSARDAIERTGAGQDKSQGSQPLQHVRCCPAEAKCEVKPMF